MDILIILGALLSVTLFWIMCFDSSLNDKERRFNVIALGALSMGLIVMLLSWTSIVGNAIMVTETTEWVVERNEIKLNEDGESYRIEYSLEYCKIKIEQDTDFTAVVGDTIIDLSFDKPCRALSGTDRERIRGIVAALQGGNNYVIYDVEAK